MKFTNVWSEEVDIFVFLKFETVSMKIYKIP